MGEVSGAQANRRPLPKWGLASIALSLGQVLITFGVGLYFSGEGGLDQGSRLSQLLVSLQFVLWGGASFCLYMGFNKEGSTATNIAASCVLLLSIWLGVVMTAV